MRTERINLIEDYILRNKSVSLDKLCEHFNVSKNTIRRDIDLLTERGLIKKVYGGVTITSHPPDLKGLTPFSERNMVLAKEKDAICKLAASLIEENDIIYIDTGTTSQNLIDYISSKHCTIITNSLQIYLKAVPYPNLTVVSLPGFLKRDTLSFVGSEVKPYLKTFNIGKAFMCCTGVTIENGLTNATFEEYLIKKAVIASSKTHYLLADHAKFGKFTLMTFSSLSDIHHVVTDQIPEDKYVDYCYDNDVSLHVVDNQH